MKKPLTYIDLFAGAGGLSEGFIKAGYKPVAHVEMDTAACYTLKTRTAYHYLKSVSKSDIYYSYLKNEITRSELYSVIPPEELSRIINLSLGTDNKEVFRQISQCANNKSVDLIIGGPPCQAYSLVGRARSENNMEGDPRNYLYVQYAKYLERYQPRMFVFENVLGLKSAKGGQYLRNMGKLFFAKGYKMEMFTVEADNFNVLQNRKRIIIIGWKNDFTPNLPDFAAIKLRQEHVVGDLLSDLPPLQAGEGIDKYGSYQATAGNYLNATGIRNGINILTQHVARPHTIQDKEIYRIAVEQWHSKKQRLNYNHLPSRLKTHKNLNAFVDRFKVVAPDLAASQTVVAHIAKDGHYYIHPDINQNRSLTVREAARLQSFADDYYFEGVTEGKSSRTAAFRQIGNAVPPLMAQVIAEKIKSEIK